MATQALNFNYMLKYIIIGDSGVGKSNILLQYLQGKFNEEFQTTIGVEFGAKNLNLKDKIYRIQIWDTAGQEMFRSITRSYYKNSVCACVVYDITNRNSFDNIRSWIEDCKKHSPKTVFLVLIGNKNDLESSRKVSYDEGEDFAKKYGMLFYETSAKTGKNINEVFMNSCSEIAKKINNGFYDLNRDTCGIKVGFNNQESIVLDDNINKRQKEKKSLCCNEK
jgi:Ras-related protein Rab-2A